MAESPLKKAKTSGMAMTDGPMPFAAQKYLLARPSIPAPLDPNFSPFILGKRKYLQHAANFAAGCNSMLEFAIERPGDCCGRDKLPVFPDDHEDFEASLYLAGEVIRYMLWQRGGAKLTLAGPAKLCEKLKQAYSAGGMYEFEAKTMPKVCGCSWTVDIVASADKLPAAKDDPVMCGKEAKGPRIAFDLGKSDVKTVAVCDGKVLASKETEWDVTNADPDYHYGVIVKAMKEMAAKLPSAPVAIGGSATGTVSAKSEATWCDCFPNVDPKVYKEKVFNIYNNIAKNEFGGVPIKVINDGEVTAVAGSHMIGKGDLFGISLGSSEGSGYVNANGALSGWINENAYCPIDLNPEGPSNPWSPHRGDASMYLGQRAATRLAVKGGVALPEDQMPDHPNMNQMNHAPHAQALKAVQAAMKDPAKKEQASKIYQTIGVYLGYAIAQYCEYLDIKHVLILGRVTGGDGGQVMMDWAKKVLQADFPELSSIEFHTPDEHMKRVGQCIAAAALPEVN